MLNSEDLKIWLHRDLKLVDKLLLVLATFDTPSSVAALKSRAAEAGFRISTSTNVSSFLSKSKGLAIRLPKGWELSDQGKTHLCNLGVVGISSGFAQVAADLRQHLAKVQNPTTRAFAEEAIKCHEARLYRAAVVMSWIAAVDVLYSEVVSKHLAAFNAEAKNYNAKWKPALNEDGLARMGEADFLDRLVSIGVIGKNVKEELAKGLKLRNGCGHPNSLKIGQNTVASHLEILLLNVFEPFSA